MNLSLRPLATSSLRCAWCHDTLAASTWRCASCAAAAHADCALEGCPTLGCRARALLVVVSPAPPRGLARRARLRRWFRAAWAAGWVAVGAGGGLAIAALAEPVLATCSCRGLF